MSSALEGGGFGGAASLPAEDFELQVAAEVGALASVAWRQPMPPAHQLALGHGVRHAAKLLAWRPAAAGHMEAKASSH